MIIETILNIAAVSTFSGVLITMWVYFLVYALIRPLRVIAAKGPVQLAGVMSLTWVVSILGGVTCAKLAVRLAANLSTF